MMLSQKLPQNSEVLIKQAATEAQFAEVKGLFLEYAETLGFSLCFQSFDEELASLPGCYARPLGRLYIVYIENKPVGCIALRPINKTDGEVKRLYIQPSHRNKGLGRLLVHKVLEDAKFIGYERLLLDTLDTMQAAIKLYESFGFRQTTPYTHNPLCGALYFELKL